MRTGPSGRVVTFDATATDVVSGPVVVTCTPASGSTFAIGTTPVSCSASDAASNTGTGSFTVTVADTTPPAIATLPHVTAQATSAAGAVVIYTAPAATDTASTPTVSCVPASGSTFALGHDDGDLHGDRRRGQYRDRHVRRHGQRHDAPPSLDDSAAARAEATSAAGSVVTFQASATDAVDGPVTPACRAGLRQHVPRGRDDRDLHRHRRPWQRDVPGRLP